MHLSRTQLPSATVVGPIERRSTVHNQQSIPGIVGVRELSYMEEDAQGVATVHSV